MVWYGMVWYGMVWYGMVWYGMDLDRSLTICNASPGDGLPNEKGSNGGDGGNGERIDSMNIWLIKIFPGGRGKFAGNGGHGGVGGESDIKYIQKVYPISYHFVVKCYVLSFGIRRENV